MANYCLGRLFTNVIGGSDHCWRSTCVLPLLLQTRNTFILKRRWPPGLTKKNRRPVLKSRHFIYDLVEDTSCKKRENIDVILTSYVQGLGDRGDKVSLKPNYAYNELLIPGLAVYASPVNIEKYQSQSSQHSTAPKFSSPTAERTRDILSRYLLSVVMNKDTEWTLQPWHLRMSFRKAGFIVPEYAIEMPKESITGPNLDIEQKEFTITVSVNRTEKVPVRCRIHHWSTDPSDRLPYVKEFWLKPADPMFPTNEEMKDT